MLGICAWAGDCICIASFKQMYIGTTELLPPARNHPGALSVCWSRPLAVVSKVDSWCGYEIGRREDKKHLKSLWTEYTSTVTT
jgi:hypothetical protein